MRSCPADLVPLVLVAALTACGAAEDVAPGNAFTVTDSAGVRVAVNAAPLWTEAARWRLADAPELEIGQAMVGHAVVPFAAVAGVHALGSGALAVYDPWAPGVFFFAEDGRFLGLAGRTGSGPGEFPARPTTTRESFACGADTVYVRVDRHFAAFAAPGTYVRDVPLDTWRVAGCTEGRFLGLGGAGERPTEPGIHITKAVLGWYDLNGQHVAHVDTLPDREREYAWSSPEGHGGLGSSWALFGRGLAMGMGQGVLATSFEPDIRLRDAAGPVRMVIRVAGAARVVDGEDVRRFEDYVMNLLRGNGQERLRMEERLEEALGKPYPLFAELRIDPAGNIWARRHDHVDAVAFYDYASFARGVPAPEQGEEPSTWMVFRPDGRWLGNVDMPPRFTVHEIGEAWVLGVWKDDYDVPFVRRYPLVQPGS